MKEVIKEIKEIFNFIGGCGEYDGFEIITNKQSIKLLISNGQCCCEHWGYFWTNDDIEEFIGAEILEITQTDTSLNTERINEEIGSVDKGDTMFVNINTNKGLLQFTAYNAHNGYYGHEVKIISEQLTTEFTL